MSERKPQRATVEKLRRYVERYREKSGTSAHPDAEVTEAVVAGLALNLEEVGRPLCPCTFYLDRRKELAEHGRRWVCACEEMKKYKYCHCRLFVTAEGKPITEYLPEDHEGRTTYGLVLDPTPGKGREAGRGGG